MKPIGFLSVLLLFVLAIQAQHLPSHQFRPTTNATFWRYYLSALTLKSTVAAAQNKTAPKKDIITLERGACFGTCPIYKVVVASDGKVTFEGFNYTKIKGKATGKINPKQFKKLVKEFEKIKYFSLDGKYVPGEPNCGQSATDMPYVKSSIQLNGKTKSISHYQGCFGSEIVRALFALDRRIDEIAGTSKWIK